MKYEWKCTACGEVRVVDRPVKDYLVPPSTTQSPNCKRHNWKRVILTPPSVDFETMYQSGELARPGEDIAPRKM